MSERPFYLALLAALGLLALLAMAAGGEGEARVADLEVAVEGERVLVSFTLEGAFDSALRRRIESGLPTELAYELRLVRRRRLLGDRALRASSLQVVAMYNALSRDYLINLKHDGQLVESRIVRDTAALEAAMTRFERFPAFSLEGLAGVRPLRVRVRAELGTRTVLGFIPSRHTTEWIESPRLGLAGEG